MKPIYWQDELITQNDLKFMCYMIERVARKLHRHNDEVIDAIPKEELYRLIRAAAVLHCMNPEQVEANWIEDYHLTPGDFDITEVDSRLCETIPTALQMGKVYMRLICDTIGENEDYVEGMMRVYRHEICKTIDNYNCSAYYEPSYYIARAYNEGGF